MEENRLIEMQEMLYRQMKRLDDDECIEKNGAKEISRGNALSQTAVTYLKNVNVGIRITELAKKYKMEEEMLAKKIGIIKN